MEQLASPETQRRIAAIIPKVGLPVIQRALDKLGPNDVVGRSLNIEGLTCTVEEMRANIHSIDLAAQIVEMRMLSTTCNADTPGLSFGVEIDRDGRESKEKGSYELELVRVSGTCIVRSK